MSHLVRRQTAMTELPLLHRACESLGMTFMPNQQQVAYYAGRREACDHAAKVPGSTFEVGFKMTEDGTYAVLADYYDQRVGETIGANASRLIQQYAVENTKSTIRRTCPTATMTQTAMDNGVQRIRITL